MEIDDNKVKIYKDFLKCQNDLLSMKSNLTKSNIFQILLEKYNKCSIEVDVCFGDDFKLKFIYMILAIALQEEDYETALEMRNEIEKI